jgi:hypothetical protein
MACGESHFNLTQNIICEPVIKLSFGARPFIMGSPYTNNWETQMQDSYDHSTYVQVEHTLFTLSSPLRSIENNGVSLVIQISKRTARTSDVLCSALCTALIDQADIYT